MHVHRWMEIARTYAPPAPAGVSATGVPGETASMWVFGVTTFVFRCSDEACGELKKIEALGQQVKSL